MADKRPKIVLFLMQKVTVLVAALCVSVAAVVPLRAESTTDYPVHVDLATMGVVMGLRGMTPATDGLPVRYTGHVLEALNRDEFKYENFFLHSSVITEYATIQGEENSWYAQGIIIFEDLAGRRAYDAFLVYYRIKSDHMEIYMAGAQPVSPPSPTIAWFAMRAGDVDMDTLSSKSHAELVMLAANSSLTFSPSRAGDYVVFALGMDRLSDDEGVTFHSDDSGVAVGAYNLNGWPVGVFSGRIDPSRIGGDLVVRKSWGDARDIVLQSFPTRPFEVE